MAQLTESDIEEAALAWLEALGYGVLHGPAIAAGLPGAERADPGYRDVVLEARLRQALARLNPDLPPEALDEAYRKLTGIHAPSLLERNRLAHRLLVDGVTVEYRRADGSIAGAQARVLDFDDPDRDDWLVVNQFTVAKTTPGESRTDAELDHAIRQIISRAVVSEEVVDIFAAAGLKTPDLSILSDEFLAEVRGMPQPNLAVELLQKLLRDEIKSRSRRNVVQARSFAELLDQAIRRYQNRAIQSAQVIEELIQLARELRRASARGETLGLSDDELAFYDALATNDGAVAVLGEPMLIEIARELVVTLRKSVTIDWTIRENVRAQIRVLVKRILRKYGYPPDKKEAATQTVLEQAELFSEEWTTRAAA